MTIFEIKKEMQNLIDFETGEVIDFDRFMQLDVDRNEKIENTLCMIANMSAEKDGVDAQKARLDERSKRLGKNIDRLKELVNYGLDGEDYKSDLWKVTHTHSKSTDITDEEKLVQWCMESGHDDLLDFKNPTPSKSRIKEYINAGNEVPFAQVVENVNIRIK